MLYTKIGDLEISRFILGGNPISGFSHQGGDRDEEMKNYYTVENIKKDFRKAEELGITTNIARGDRHIKRVMREYYNEGGNLQWIVQTPSELGEVERGVNASVNSRGKACFIHGGILDNYYANDKLDLIEPAVKIIKDAGMPAGVAGHNPDAILWAEKNLDLDFYMCCYYNPSSRSGSPHHKSGIDERFADEDRDRMIEVIQSLSKPVLHYKILAAGRNNPEEAFKVAAEAIRPQDAVVVGIFSKDDPDMLEKDVELFLKYNK